MPPNVPRKVRSRGGRKAWKGFVGDLRAAIEETRNDGGAGIRFLTETVTSPPLIDQFAKVKAELPNAKWIQYEPVNQDNVLTGAKLAFGAPVQAIYKFDKAERILSLDADIFSSFNVGYIKDYAAGKNFTAEHKGISRLYSV